MTIYLFEPLIDEPLFSCVGRYIASMNAPPRSVLEHVFGYPARPSSVAFGLSQMERVTRSSWGMSSREIAEQRTAYPYFAALLPPPQAKSLLETMLRPLRQGNFPSVLRLLGGKRRIGFCNACFGEDLRSGVAKHWRRAHQLPGVCVCPWHGEMLWEVLNPRAIREGYILPQDLPELESSKIVIELSEEQLHACHQVARLSNWLLSNNVLVNVDSFKEQFLKFASGKTLGSIELRKQTDMETAVHSYFGTGFLKWIGMGAGQPNGVGRRLFGNRYSSSTMPVRTVILAASCSATTGIGHYSRKPPLYSPEPLPMIYCVNEEAAHGPGHFVDHLRRREGRYFAASCNCGMRFRFTKYSGHRAIAPQPSQVGSVRGQHSGGGKSRSPLGQAVLALRAEGKSRKEVGALLKLDMKSVANFERIRQRSTTPTLNRTEEPGE